jgi:6-phosphogluconolactonase (cycloisomerase 2 family)
VGGRGNLSYQLSYASSGEGSTRLQMSVNGDYLYVLDQYEPGSTPNVTPASATKTSAYPCWDSANKVYRPAGDITVYQINASTGRLFLVQNLQQQNAQGTPLTYFPVGCGPVDFYLNSGYLYTGEASDPSSGATQVVYAYAASATTGQLTQVPGGAQPIGTTSMSYLDGSANGEWIYILDNGSNKIYTFQPGSNGLLSAVTGGSVDNLSSASGMDALTTDSQTKYLYVANTQSNGLNQSGSVLSVFNITASSGVLTPSTPSSYGVGSTPVCVFEDPSHQFVYTADAGSSTVTGAAYDPNTGNLSNLTAGSTWNVVGTPTWCLYSSNTY